VIRAVLFALFFQLACDRLGVYSVRQNVYFKGMVMTENIKTELDCIQKAIFSNIDPVSIYLFGSYAYGQPGPESDIDIYLVIPDTDSDTIELGANIRYELYKKIKLPFDLLTGKKSTFEKRSKHLTLENTIAKQGVLLYGE
jgi:predicted nucleotidyltransferase